MKTPKSAIFKKSLVYLTHQSVPEGYSFRIFLLYHGRKSITTTFTMDLPLHNGRMHYRGGAKTTIAIFRKSRNLPCFISWKAAELIYHQMSLPKKGANAQWGECSFCECKKSICKQLINFYGGIQTHKFIGKLNPSAKLSAQSQLHKIIGAF